MKRFYIAVVVAAAAGIGIGMSVRSADAQAPMRPLLQAGGPMVPVGASGTATVAWVLEPASRTIWACTNAAAPTCAKTQLP